MKSAENVQQKPLLSSTQNNIQSSNQMKNILD